MAEPRHDYAPVRRTVTEKLAYLQGFEACLKQLEKGVEHTPGQTMPSDKDRLMSNLRVALAAFDLMKETL